MFRFVCRIKKKHKWIVSRLASIGNNLSTPTNRQCVICNTKQFKYLGDILDGHDWREPNV